MWRRWVLTEQILDGRDRKRQDQAFRFGELERSLERGLASARVAELPLREGIEQQRVHRRPPTVKRRRRLLDPGREQLDRRFGPLLRELDGGRRDSRLSPVQATVRNALQRVL